jgi:uncharacterized protein YejL (UPF0352 family)
LISQVKAVKFWKKLHVLAVIFIKYAFYTDSDKLSNSSSHQQDSHDSDKDALWISSGKYEYINMQDQSHHKHKESLLLVAVGKVVAEIIDMQVSSKQRCDQCTIFYKHLSSRWYVNTRTV